MAQIQETFLFQPTQVSGCQLWLDAADSSTVSLSGLNVTQWNDKSGNGRNAIVSSNAFATYSGNPRGLRFNNSLYTTTYTADPTNETSFTVFNYTDGYPNIIIIGAYSGGRSIAIFNTVNNVGIIKAMVAWGPTTPITPNAIQMATAIITSGSSTSVAANGGTPATGGAFSFTSGSNTILGRENGDSLPFGGFLYETIFYNSVLPIAQIQRIEGYLAWKWGFQASLPANHPYKTYRPLAQTPFPTTISPMPNITQGTAVFDPRSISGCVMWLDAADRTTTTLSGTNVMQWRDKSSNANHFNAAGVGTAPITSNYNGLQTVYWTGTSQQLTSSKSNATSGNASRTIFVLIYNPLTTSKVYMVTGTESGAAAATAYGFGKNANADYVYPFLYSATGADIFTFVQITNVPTILSSTFDGSTLNGWINSSYNITKSTTLNTTSDVWYLGLRQQSGNGSIDSYMLEIIQYNSSLSTLNRQQVEGYLAWKWGFTSSLPNGHPYKRPPLAPFAYPIAPVIGSLNQWIPTQISNSSLWYDGADASSLTLVGSKVSQWRNKGSSGASFHISQSTDALRPSYTQGVGLVFTASASNVLSNSVPPTYSTAINSYCVFTANNTSRMRMLKLFGNSVIGSVLDTTVPSMFLSGTSYFYNAFSITASQRYVQSQNIYSASARGFSLNFTEQTNLTADLPSASSSLLFVGGEATVFFDGTIHEIITFDGFLTVQQRQQVEGYLAWKWGLQGSLPRTHPFKLFPPSP